MAYPNLTSINAILPNYAITIRWFIAVLVILTARVLSAQNIIPRFETLGVNEGLSQSSVYSIYQDRTGFMWFGTADGLNRYDGSVVKVFKVRNNIIANSNYVRGNICEDAKGNIWFCNETGIFCYDRIKDELQRKFILEYREQAHGVFIDRGQLFWILGTDGICSFNINTREWQKNKERFTPSVLTSTGLRITTDNDHNIWFKNNAYGIHYFNTLSRSYKHMLTDQPVNCVHYLNGKIFYWNKNVLTIADTLLNTISQKRYPGTDKVLAVNILPDAYGRVWMTTSNAGLLCYDSKKDRFTWYRHDNSRQRSLPFDITTTLFVDAFDNLWTGTDGGGVTKLNLKPANFNLFPQNDGEYIFMKDYFTKCFYEDKKGRIWFGTNNNGFNIFDPADGKIKNYHFDPANKNLPGNIIASIFSDKQDNIWIGSCLGLFIFNEQRGSFKKIKAKGLIDEYIDPGMGFIYKLKQLSDGRMISATSLGLLIAEKNAASEFIASPTGGSGMGGLFTDVEEMPNGDLYATGPIRGLYHYKKNGRGYSFHDITFKGMDLRSLHLDEKDRSKLWVSSGNGLIDLDTKTLAYKNYNEANGMANSYVYGVLEDGRHNFWISTNGGISYLNRSSNTFKNYDVNDGLQSNEFNTAAFYKSHTGTMYFGGIKGFNWFHPDVFFSGKRKPKVALTDILVDEKPYVKDAVFVEKRSIRLPYHKNNLAFSFAALDLTQPAANKVAYMLGGWDNKWVVTRDKNVRFANLSPGEYHLYLKAANGDEVWSDIEKYDITIEAPFWQRPWFYATALFLAMGLVIYITYSLSQVKIKKKLRELEKQNAVTAERNRISRDMHDEIGSGLTHIALLSELIQTQNKTDEAIKQDVGSISTAARKLIENMSEIIWAFDPYNDQLENLLSYTREQMKLYFEPFDITLTIEFPDAVPAVKLTNEQRRNLYLVTKEALNNAMKHAHATNVMVCFSMADDLLQFKVSDNGSGLKEDKGRTNGNGLKNMRKRMEDIGGSIEWINEKKGLAVEYSLCLSPTPSERRGALGRSQFNRREAQALSLRHR